MMHSISTPFRSPDSPAGSISRETSAHLLERDAPIATKLGEIIGPRFLNGLPESGNRQCRKRPQFSEGAIVWKEVDHCGSVAFLERCRIQVQKQKSALSECSPKAYGDIGNGFYGDGCGNAGILAKYMSTNQLTNNTL